MIHYSIIPYVGITTMALANVKEGTAISLIDMVKFQSSEIKDSLKQSLLGWAKSKILFPRTLAEFEKILQDISQS